MARPEPIPNRPVTKLNVVFNWFDLLDESCHRPSHYERQPGSHAGERQRYEVIDGELHVSSAPGFLHRSILTDIVLAFGSYLREHPIGRITPGVGVIFDDFNRAIPDLVFATLERMRKTLAGSGFRAAPEIIEILSSGASNERRDRHVEHSLYAARGVGEYWVVDPENRSVEVPRRNQADDQVFEMSFQQRDQLTSELLPGVAVPVDALFVIAQLLRNCSISLITSCSSVSRVVRKASIGCPNGSTIFHSISLRGLGPGSP